MRKTYRHTDLMRAVGNRKSRFLAMCLLLITLLTSVFPASTIPVQASSPVRGSLSLPRKTDDKLEAIEKAVETRRRELGIPGLSLAIVKNDQVIFSKGFGSRNIEKNLPVTTDTLFAIGSTTKAFTAMTTLMTADSGKLTLEDSPKKLLPFFNLRDPEADAQATLRDLLSHRVGIDRTDMVLQFSGSLTREEVIKVVGNVKPTAKFRERFQYQNVMFVAAGEAAAKANNMSWEKLVETKIFKSLAMNKTNTSIAEMQKSADYSLGYQYNPATKETKNLKMIDLSKIAPAGAINSNARDMGQWLKLLIGGGVFDGKRLVSEKSFGEMFTSQIQIAPKVGYGLGWFVREWRGKKEVDHAGNIDGFNASIAIIPEEKLGLILLTNVTASPLSNEIREIVFSNLLGQPQGNAEAKNVVVKPVPEIQKTHGEASKMSPVLQEILGNYETEQNGTPIDIIVNANSVSIVMQGQPPRRLVEKATDVFTIEGLPENYNLAIKRDENGKIDDLFFNQRDTAARLRSVKLPPDAQTVDEVMKRVIEAAGGEANLRKHSSMQMKATVDLEYEGITGNITTSAKAPNLSASSMKYSALGKQIGETFNYFDGTNGGGYTMDNQNIVGTPYQLSGKFLEDTRIADDFYASLNWKTLYKTIELKKTSRIADEEVYVVVKTPERGNPITDYISQKSFLVLRRETAQPAGGGQIVPYVENFSDFRPVDGVIMPFKITSGVPGSKLTVTNVQSIEFNIAIPDSAFRPLHRISQVK